MSLIDQLRKDSETALRSGDILKTETLRGLLAALHNREIELRGEAEITEEEVIGVLGKEAKKRKEAGQIYTAAGRPELANKEAKELDIIKSYLPPELTADEVEAIVKRATDGGLTDFGRVMGAVMKEVAGRAEAGTVKEIVKKILESENRK
ncbi:MAG: GatB/YqeY domain-containing protein [Parcubacteria group bacterium]|nr:GatB/YqeY domain-containing protein [Parcubacteria group bacterium]